MKLSDLKNLPPEKLFVVIDGSSYLFRAFYAPHLNALTAPDGVPSGAIYGVLTMLKRLENLLPIHHNGGISEGGHSISACFVMDEKGGSFRNEIYSDYKANRGKPPDELVVQIEPLKQVIQELGWSLLSKVGFEADDLIATLVQQAKAEGKVSVIVTGDKDLAQLVDDQTFMLDTMKDEWLDQEGVGKKFGVPPSQIIDFLTLIGDTSDNVPGVNKVGPKTAVKWLQEMESLDHIMEQAENIKGVVGQNLREALTWLPTARTLITLKHDVSLPEGFAPEFKAADKEALQASYTRWGFKKLLADLGKPAQQPSTKEVSGGSVDLFGENVELGKPVASKLASLSYEGFVCLNQPAELEAWLDEAKKTLAQTHLLAIDTETTGLNPHVESIVGISLSYDGKHAAYIPLGHHQAENEQMPIETVVAILTPLFSDTQINKTGHNIRFDRIVLSRIGLSLKGVLHDTALSSLVFEANQKHGLEDVSARWLGLGGISFDEIVSQSTLKKNIAGVPIAKVTEYACEDAALAWLCGKHAEQLIQKNEKLARVYALEQEVSEVLFHMECAGIRIDADELRNYSVELKNQCAELEAKAHQLAGVSFNLASPKQLQELLFTRMGLKPLQKTAKGAASTNEEVLEQLAQSHPDLAILRHILDYRQLSKLNNTYAEKLPQDLNERTGRVHTRYSQIGAITGRLASSDPNVQNIPVKTAEGRRIRQAFIPETGWTLISADYSQIELRVMAHCANDESMRNAFSEGADIHRKTASEIFSMAEEDVTVDERRYAKAINFGLIYGMSAFGLARAIGVDRASAQTFIDRYFARYPAIAQWMEDTVQQASIHGFVETLYGRRISISGINAGNAHARQAAGRFAINAPIQGSAADIIKCAMIDVFSWLSKEKLRTRLLLQVHDELVLESPPEERDQVMKMLPQLMQKPAEVLGLTVPLEVNIGSGAHWDAAH